MRIWTKLKRLRVRTHWGNKKIKEVSAIPKCKESTFTHAGNRKMDTCLMLSYNISEADSQSA